LWKGGEILKIYCPFCSEETGNTLSRNKLNGVVSCKKCGIRFEITLKYLGFGEKEYTSEEQRLFLLHNNPDRLVRD